MDESDLQCDEVAIIKVCIIYMYTATTLFYLSNYIKLYLILFNFVSFCFILFISFMVAYLLWGHFTDV